MGSASEVLSGNNHLTDQNFSATYTIDPNEHCLLTLNLSRCVSGKCEQRSTKLAVSADGDKALSVGGQDPLEEKGESLEFHEAGTLIPVTTRHCKGDIFFKRLDLGLIPPSDFSLLMHTRLTPLGFWSLITGTFLS